CLSPSVGTEPSRKLHKGKPLVANLKRPAQAEVVFEQVEVSDIYRTVAIEVCACLIIGVSAYSIVGELLNDEILQVDNVVFVGVARPHETYLQSCERRASQLHRARISEKVRAPGAPVVSAVGNIVYRFRKVATRIRILGGIINIRPAGHEA